MFATLMLWVLAAVAAPAETRECAAAKNNAIQAAGTETFAAAWKQARKACGDDAGRELVELDRAQREWQHGKDAESASAPQPRPAPAAEEPPLDVYQFSEAPEELLPNAQFGQQQPAAAYEGSTTSRVVYYDQDTGLDLVAGIRDPGAPWTGLAVNNFTVAVNGVQAVCVLKDGVPIPLGEDVPFSLSHERGAPVYSCAAAQFITGSTVLYVPDGAVIQMATYDPLRQVYVVEETRLCLRPTQASGRVAHRTATSCRYQPK